MYLKSNVTGCSAKIKHLFQDIYTISMHMHDYLSNEGAMKQESHVLGFSYTSDKGL